MWFGKQVKQEKNYAVKWSRCNNSEFWPSSIKWFGRTTGERNIRHITNPIKGRHAADRETGFFTIWRSSLDSSLTTTPRPFSSLNMLTRSSQEKPQTICRSSPEQNHKERRSFVDHKIKKCHYLCSRSLGWINQQTWKCTCQHHVPLVLCPVYSVLMAEEPLRFSRIMESAVNAESRSNKSNQYFARSWLWFSYWWVSLFNVIWMNHFEKSELHSVDFETTVPW